ncbi:putative peptide/nitrate transporter [Porphyridium purpureum]|uniref:Putative peptide/nitrate transporter n=1 Tax=Porphyridium purpureum TaxID=35688 RepID=A0A5J4YPI0_PORPP|nr:putative peptide/nitrate transporter [Porphyridium purpureum]|eukprot:POR0877..scf222_8
MRSSTDRSERSALLAESKLGRDEKSVAETDDDGQEDELSTGLILTCLFAYFVEAFNLFGLFAYSVFMIRDFGIQEKHVGTYAGLLGSTWPFAQTFASLIWGSFSDRYGRKPALMMGAGATAVFSLGFGFSQSFWQAAAFRILGGIFNGNVSVVKTIMAESTTRSNQARAFATIGLSYSLGIMLAPTLCGLVSRPCENRVFAGALGSLCSEGDGLMAKFPYLAPNILQCALSVLSVLIVKLCLVETREAAEDNSAAACMEDASTSQPPSTAILEVETPHVKPPTDLAALRKSSTHAGHSVVAEPLIRIGSEQQPSLRQSYSYAGKQASAKPSLKGRAVHRRCIMFGQVYEKTESGAMERIVSKPRHRNRLIGHIRSPSLDDLGNDGHDSDPENVEEERLRAMLSMPISFRPPVLDRERVEDVVHEIGEEMDASRVASQSSYHDVAEANLKLMAILGYAGGCFSQIIYDEGFPIYTSSPTSVGGLSFSPQEVGIALLFGGVVLFVYQIWFWPHVAAWLGPVKAFRAFLWLQIAAGLLIPTASIFAFRRCFVLEWAVILIAQTLKVIGQATSFTAVNILVSNSAAPHERGWVSGMSQASAALVRTVGPTVGGALWSLSTQLTEVPYHQSLIFMLSVFSNMVLYWWSARLPETLNYPQSQK